MHIIINGVFWSLKFQYHFDMELVAQIIYRRAALGTYAMGSPRLV